MIQTTNGTKLWFGKGKFDNWCIYVQRPDKSMWFPLDLEYFTQLRSLGRPRELYRDFCVLYDLVGDDAEAMDFCTELAHKYSPAIELLFAVLYMGMVAVENKEGTKLGKRIKRLGMHQVLLDGWTPEKAANYSRDMSWRAIDIACRERGF